MSDLHGKLDEVYAPTPYQANRVAHAALHLMRYALLAVESQEAGLRIGRDVSMELSAHTLELARLLMLVDLQGGAAEFEAFAKDLNPK